MIAVAVISVILGGYFWTARPRTIELRMSPQPLRANVNHEVFDIVLTDLLVNDDFLFSKDRDGKQVSRIVFSSMTEEGCPEDLEGSNCRRLFRRCDPQDQAELSPFAHRLSINLFTRLSILKSLFETGESLVARRRWQKGM
jgi:hypothetical protein